MASTRDRGSRLVDAREVTRLFNIAKRYGLHEKTPIESYLSLIKDMRRNRPKGFEIDSITAIEEVFRQALASKGETQIRIRQLPEQILMRARDYASERKLEHLNDWPADRRSTWLKLVRYGFEGAIKNPDQVNLISKFHPEFLCLFRSYSDRNLVHDCAKISEGISKVFEATSDTETFLCWAHEAAVSNMQLGENARAISYCEKGIAATLNLQTNTYAEIRGHLLHRRAFLHVVSGDLIAGRRLLSDALESKRRMLDPVRRAWETNSTISAIGVIDELEGRLTQAQACQRACIERQKDKIDGAAIDYRLARVLRKQGKFTEAIRIARKMYTRSIEAGSHRNAFRLAVEGALSNYFADNWSDARVDLARARKIAKKCAVYVGGGHARLNFTFAQMLLKRRKWWPKAPEADRAIRELMATGFAYRSTPCETAK